MHVVGVEYPGYGVNRGLNASENSVNQDVRAVFRFLTRCVRWPSRKIILFGFSIGTGPMTNLASQDFGRRVGGLCLLSPYSSIRDMVKTLGASKVGSAAIGKCASYLISNRFNNLRQIQNVTAPTLIISGKADTLIPWTQGQAVYEAAAAKRKQFYEAHSMDHCYTQDDIDAYVMFPLAEFFGLNQVSEGDGGQTWDSLIDGMTH